MALEPLNVSVEECAHLLGLGITLTKQLIRDGTILSYHEGRRRVVPMTAIHEYQAGRVADARAEKEAADKRQRQARRGTIGSLRGRNIDSLRDGSA